MQLFFVDSQQGSDRCVRVVASGRYSQP